MFVPTKEQVTCDLAANEGRTAPAIDVLRRCFLAWVVGVVITYAKIFYQALIVLGGTIVCIPALRVYTANNACPFMVCQM